MRLTTCSWILTASLCALSAPTFSSVAHASDLMVDVGEATGSVATVSIENSYEYDVKVVNVRLRFDNDDGSRTFYYSQPNWSVDVGSVEGEDAGWSGELTFTAEDGSALPESVDLMANDGTSVAAGVDLDVLHPMVDEAVAGDMAAISTTLAFVRARVEPVSRASRLHGTQIAASGVPVNQWFNLERIDGMVTTLEEGACAAISRRAMGTSPRSLPEMYPALGQELQSIGLHVNCMTSDAKLRVAQALVDNGRPQDALVIVETEDGLPTEPWREIFIAGNLALARTAAELNMSVFSAIQPALVALTAVHTIAPDNADLRAVADILIPNASRWLTTASEPMTLDLENAERAVHILRPTWSSYEQVETAAGAFAAALIGDGMAQCEQGNFINSRNRFARGERILEGIPEWDSQSDSINRCRAMGSLQEGRELAGNIDEPEGPAKGMEKLDEALGRYELSDDVVNAYQADMANAWVAHAVADLEGNGFAGARDALEKATELSPTGATSEIQNTWLTYAETRYSHGGMLMSGAHVADAREAVEFAGDVDEARSSAVSSQLSMAYYGYRAGLPGGVLLIALLGGLVVMSQKKKAARMVAELDD
ncbi:MAG: hypothetical protein ACI81R_000908 [Bradymonadia bacterium]|jgi:hypothetical protein